MLNEEYDSAIEDMSVADMPNEDMAYVAQACGLETAIILLRKLSGMEINVPKRCPFGKVAERFIIEKFDGTNTKKLAHICDLSRRKVEKIIQKEDKCRLLSRSGKHEQMKLPLFPENNGDQLKATGS